MQKQELEKYINHIILRVRNAEQVEENKIELKSEWYNFLDRDNKKQVESEFLKDLTAIANTAGPTGYLIIGINEKSGELKNSPFSECGLQDVSAMQKLVVKSVNKPIDFEYLELNISEDSKSFIIGVFIIPPSLEKPHVISYYLSKKSKEIINYIPVKKTTGIHPATRSDIEFMYYDRKNIEPEYALEIKSYKPQLVINTSQNELRIDFQICFQNYGRKPITIVELILHITEILKEGLPNTLDLKLNRYELNISNKSEQYYLPSKFIVIPGNSVSTVYCHFNTNFSEKIRGKLVGYLRATSNNYLLNIEATDLNEKKYLSEINNFR
jgi:hypothetical protein